MRYLKIKNISFPNNKIPTKWFKPDIKIISLVIDDKFLTSIEANAFNTSAFDKLDFLSLINMPIKQLQSGMFTGLRMLHHLEFIGMPISTFASDLFAPCPVLSSLIIRNVEPTNITLLDLVSSLQPEMKLLTLKHFNLSGQITEENLSIIKILDALTLEDDHITDIAPHSFDSFASTLRFLDLRNNLLKTLPGGVIPTSLLVGASPDNFIFLEGNPFHCSCELAHLKRIYQQYFSKFVGRLYCETPLKFKGVSLLDVELCGDQEITTMNGTSNLSTVTTQSPNNSMSGREIFRWSTINLEVIVAMGAMLIIIVVLIVGGIALVVCRRFKKKDGVNGTIDEVVLKRYRSEPYVELFYYIHLKDENISSY